VTGLTGGNIQDGTDDGYEAAKAQCETACRTTDAHMCNAEEMVLSAQLGNTIDSGSSAWYSGGAAGVINGSPVEDCVGWTSSDGDVYGPVWLNTASSSRPSVALCQENKVVACCAP